MPSGSMTTASVCQIPTQEEGPHPGGCGPCDVGYFSFQLLRHVLPFHVSLDPTLALTFTTTLTFTAS